VLAELETSFISCLELWTDLVIPIPYIVAGICGCTSMTMSYTFKTRVHVQQGGPPSVPVALTASGEKIPQPYRPGRGYVGTLLGVLVESRVHAACIHPPLEAH